MLFEFLPVNCPFTLLAFNARICGISFSWYPKGLHQYKNIIEDLISIVPLRFPFRGGMWGVAYSIEAWDSKYCKLLGRRIKTPSREARWCALFLGGVQDIMAFMDGTVFSTCKMDDTNLNAR